MLQFSNLNRVRVMEPETISKNGASLKSHMSKGIMFCLLLIVSFSFCCCTEEITPTTTVSNESIIRGPIIFDSEGGVKDVLINCDIVLTEEAFPEWIKISKTGNVGDQIFHLTALKNELSETRAGNVLCTGKKVTEDSIRIVKANISVVQYGQKIE